MFERFTTAARLVVVNSQEHARRLGHHHIGTEHLLLALVSLDGEVGGLFRAAGATPAAVESAARRLIGAPGSDRIDRAALAAIGIDLDLVHDRIAAQFGPLPSPPVTRWRRHWRRRGCLAGTGHIPFTPRAKKCLELSLREAKAMGDRHIGAEHIALGLTLYKEGIATELFTELGVSAKAVRAEIYRLGRKAG